MDGLIEFLSGYQGLLTQFLLTFKAYFIELVPPLALGLLISGIIHEFVPQDWVERNMSAKGIMPIFYSTLIGAIVPVCCWGSLPIAVSFHKKGASLGPIFAFLVATPATSINALFVAWRFLGLPFMLYIFFTVIVMGVLMGFIGNMITVKRKESVQEHSHAKDDPDCACKDCHDKKTVVQRIKAVLRYAFITMPKEIGLETLIGIFMAALVSVIKPIGAWIGSYLTRGYAFVFAVAFGLLVYMCSTMSIPLVHAFIKQGLNAGAGLSLLIIGPIVSYGTILVLRKEFGFKTLFIFIASISILSVIAGNMFNMLGVNIRLL